MSNVTFIYCCICGKEDPGPAGRASFAYCDFWFDVPKQDGECEDCAGTDERKIFDEIGSSLITRTVGAGVKVNWDWYATHILAEKYGAPFNALLLALGILSVQAQTHWAIVSGGEVNIGPSYPFPFRNLFFRSEDDAVEYARRMLANTKYSWEIRHISRIIPREEVLEAAVVS